MICRGVEANVELDRYRQAAEFGKDFEGRVRWLGSKLLTPLIPLFQPY
jgi:hypothetical protein